MGTARERWETWFGQVVERVGGSYAELARRVGSHENTVGGWGKGALPNPAYAKALAAILGDDVPKVRGLIDEAWLERLGKRPPRRPPTTRYPPRMDLAKCVLPRAAQRLVRSAVS